jgi:four helix bundle protein
MVARHYRELVCWQLSNELKRRVYAFIANPPASKDFEFCKQIRGSARGAPRTISEGFGRFRPPEFARYLEFARASLIETQNHLDDALDSDYITTDLHHELFKLADRAIGATTKLQQYLQTCKEPPRANRGERRTPGGNSEPRTANAEPRTRNAEPRTRNAEPRTRNRQPRTKNER